MPRAAGRGLVLLVVLTLAAAGALFARPAQAAITNTFTARFEANTNGSVLLRGNANMGCSPLVSGCVSGRNGISTGGQSLNDNGYTMIYTDADGDPATFNDSTATVDVPPGSTVLFAGLYWGADPSAGTSGLPAPTPANKNAVRLRTPAGATWNPITASSLYTISPTGAYQGFADVTARVAAGGNGVYGVADIQAGTGQDRYAGWALAIAYRNPAEDLRALRVYDGFGSISSGIVDIPVTGFETPHTGPVNARIGAVAYEGDLGNVGDGLKLDGQPLSDAVNPATNVFNSTVSEGGTLVGGRNPGYSNLFGVDIDQLDATGLLGTGVTQAKLTMTTAGDTYYPGVFTFAIDLYAPKIVTTITSADVNGGDLLPGDEIEYRIAVRNDGSDTADAVQLSDAIPTHTTYVPGSLAIAGVPVTDAIDGDGGKFSGGAAGFALGSIPYANATYVTFRVRVDVTTPAGFAIANLVNVSYTGRTTSVAVSGAGGTVATPVLPPRADLSATLTVDPDFVQRAGTPYPIDYTAIVTNNGTDLEPAAGAELTLPAGVDPGTLPAGCTAAGRIVTCALGPLLAGTSATVSVPADVQTTAAASAVATVRAYGSGLDPAAGNDTDTAAIAVNSPPQAVADAATTTNGAPVTVPVRDNDSDPDGARTDLSVSITTPPAHGTAVVEADGTVTYTPTLGWAGPDTFGYTVDDPSGGSGTAIATVTTANALPVANADSINTPSGTLVTLAVLANDTDPNGDPLSVVTFTQPPAGSGTVTLSGNVISYLPSASVAGPVAFTYSVADSRGGQAVGQVHVDVENAVPTAADDLAATDYLTGTSIDVLANDTDPNHDLLTITGTTPAGVATVAGNRITYLPPAAFSGTTTFSYDISDGHGGMATAQVTVTVADAPPVAGDQAVTTGYGTPVPVTVLTGASDDNHDPLRVSGVTNPAHGLVVRNLDDTVTYTPDVAFSGTDTFDYTIDDGRGGTDTGRVTVTVANGVPVARPDSVTVQGGVPLAIDVLANDDDDPNGDPLVVAVDLPPAAGAVAVGPDGRITYTPAPGYRGADFFHYTVDDGNGGTSGATVTIGVVNSTPVARPDSVGTDTDTPVTIAALGNDSDPNADPLTVVGVTAAAHGTVVLDPGGTLTYTPAGGFSGTDTVIYTIEDPQRSSASATVTITVGNAAPIAGDDQFVVPTEVTTALAVLVNDRDPNTGQVLTVASVGPAGRGAVVLAADGTVSYRSDPGGIGPDTFTYVLADDQGSTDTATVTVTINGRPAAVDDAVPLGTMPADIPVLANDTDPEHDPLTVTAAGTPGHGTTAINPDGTVRYRPDLGFLGADGFGYDVRDPVGNTASAHVTVEVRNAAPVARPDDAAVLGDRLVDVDVLANDTDPDAGQTLAIDAVGTPSAGTATVRAGRIRYVPDSGWTGRAGFTYQVRDGHGGTAQATVTVTVSDGTPVAAPDNATTPYQRAVTVRVLANDLDPGDSLTVAGVTTPDHGTAAVVSRAEVGYTPPAGFSGVATFGYTAIDDAGHRTTALVRITVGTPPVVPDKAVADRPGAAVDIGLPSADQSGRPVTVRSIGNPAHGTARLNADGTVTYTPDAGFVGVDTFTYEVVDSDGNVARATVTVTVAAPPPPPTVPPTPTPTPTPTLTTPPTLPTPPISPSPLTPSTPTPPRPTAPRPPRPTPTTARPPAPPPPSPPALPLTGRDVATMVGTGTFAVLAGALAYWLGTPPRVPVPPRPQRHGRRRQ